MITQTHAINPLYDPYVVKESSYGLRFLNATFVCNPINNIITRKDIIQANKEIKYHIDEEYRIKIQQFIVDKEEKEDYFNKIFAPK